MTVRTYVSPNKLEALLKIREELGPQAVIISERKFKKGGLMGAFGKDMVEVVAARKDEEIVEVATVRSRKALTDDEIEEVNTRQRTRKANNPPELVGKISKLEEDICFLRAAIEEMNKNAVVQMSVTDDLPEMTSKKSIDTIAQMIGGPIMPSSRPPKVVALIGPTGVGKTTTIAKLAADFGLTQRKRVGLITLDTFRIAAVEQLRTYAQIMDIPFEIASSPEEILEAVNTLSNMDFVFIDTVGRSQKSARHLDELKKALEPVMPETHLVLSATTKTKDLIDIVGKFTHIPTHRLLFTKLDETDNLDNIHELYERFSLPISYLTTGQRVPEDIELATEVRMRELCCAATH